MAGRVIQGFFLGAGPGLPAAPARTAVSPPAPPSSPFAPLRALAQARPVQPHAARSTPVDAAQLGLAVGGGQSLPPPVRAQMEGAFGADFSGVRIHVGAQAQRIGAVAFTIGTDIYFAPGRYQPGTVHGRQLLGHELAHVVQQRAGRVRAPAGSGIAVVQDRALEAEADRLGARAAVWRLPVQAKLAPGKTTNGVPRAVGPLAATARGQAATAIQRMLSNREMLKSEVDSQSTHATAWLNDDSPTMTLYGTGHSGGLHAEDKIKTYIELHDIKGKTLVIYLTKSPCTCTERTVDMVKLPATGKGCAEMLAKLADSRDLKFQLLIRNLYSPSIALADRASAAALDWLQSLQRFGISVDKDARSTEGKKKMKVLYDDKEFDEDGFVIGEL